MSDQIQPIKPANAMLRPGVSRPPVSAGMNAITPREIIGILRRHVWLIICFTMTGLIIGGTAWFIVRKIAPKYTATTAINVLQPGDNDPMVIGSRDSNKDNYYQFRFTMASYIRQQSTYQELLKRDKVRETNWFGGFDSDVDRVKNLQKNLGVSPQREGNWIVISMRCGSKKESALIVNEMVDLFLKMRKAETTRDVKAKLQKRNAQRNLISRELANAENNLKQIRGSTNFSNLSGANFNDYLDEKLGSLEVSIGVLEGDIGLFESQINTLRKRSEGDLDDVTREQIERDAIAQNTRLRISNFKVALASLLTKFGEDHRQVLDMRESLRQADKELRERQQLIADLQRKSNLINAEEGLVAMTAKLESLTKQRQSALLEYKNIDNIRADYEQVETIRDEKQKALESMNTFIEKLNAIHDDPTLSKVSSIGSAPEPLVMSSPKMLVYFPAGFILGFMAGVGLAFAIEMLNDLIRSPSDVVRYLHVPLLGMICHIEEDDEVADIDMCHVVRQAPYSVMSECYRQFRTNLKLSGRTKSHKSLLITSGGAGDGKTSVAINMTSTLLAENSKVLLIDSNFRRPSTSVIFPHTGENGSVADHPDFGLSNYLMGQCSCEEVIRPSGVGGLDIIDSGPLPSNSAEILGGESMSRLLDRCGQVYDYVIIDGPPLLLSDAMTLASQVDGTIVVFNAAMTRRGAAQRALRELRNNNAEIAGAVLLGVRVRKGGYFQEVYRSYQEYQQVQIAQPV